MPALPPLDQLVPVDYNPFADEEGLDQTYAQNQAQARLDADRRRVLSSIDNNTYRFASDDLSQGDVVVGINRNPLVGMGDIQGREGWAGPPPTRFSYPQSGYTNPFSTPEYGIQSGPDNPVLSDRPPEIPPGYSETRGKHSQYTPQGKNKSAPYRSDTLTPVDYDPFAMEPVEHDPFARATNAYEQALQDYPILRDQGIVGGPGNASQRLEFWPANEPGAPNRPRPDFIPIDKPGVELGTDNVRSIDVLGDVVSHHMVEKDPVVKRYYERFIESLTPDQKQRLQEQYQYAAQNENETRPYEQWEEKSGLPAYFRGYAFQQWPKEFNERAYTPEQRGHFDRMMNYLQRR